MLRGEAHLHGYGCVDRILLADIAPTFAEKLRARTKRSRFVVRQADAVDTQKLTELLNIDIFAGCLGDYLGAAPILRAMSRMKASSFATNFVKSVGLEPTASMPCASNCLRISGSASTFTVSP